MPCSPQSTGRASVSGSGQEEAMQGPGLDHRCSAPCLSDPGKNPAGLSWRLSWRVWDALPSLVTQFSVVPRHWCRHQPGILGQHLQHDLAH